MEIQKAILEVTKEVECKYYHDTIYCKSTSQIVQDIRKMWTNFQEGKRLAKAGRLTLTKAKAYTDMIKNKDTLFDVSTDVVARKELLKLEWGVVMGEREKTYLEDQRGPRLLSCDQTMILFSITQAHDLLHYSCVNKNFTTCMQFFYIIKM